MNNREGGEGRRERRRRETRNYLGGEEGGEMRDLLEEIREIRERGRGEEIQGEWEEGNKREGRGKAVRRRF